MDKPRKLLKKISLPLFLALVAFQPDADAQSSTAPAALKQLSLEDLSKIDVTSPSKEPVPAFQTPMALYVITNEDIRRSGAASIPELLRLAPGVEVARINSNQWSIGIRGFGSRLARSVLVLIDGRTVYTTLLAGTYWEVQDTVMEDIDRIEIIRGPGGTIWGPNAVDGVINIITKDTKDTHGTMVSADGGNIDQGSLNLRYGGGNGKGFNYRVYGKGFTKGPQFHPDRANFDDWRGAQAGFRLDWRGMDPTGQDRDVVTLQGDIYDQDTGQRVNAVTYAPPFSRLATANAELSGGNVMGRWQRRLSPRDDIQIQAYYDRTRRFEPNFGEIRNTVDIDFLQHLALPARQQLSWGLGARWSHGDDRQVVSGLSFSPAIRTDHLYTVFLQDEIALIENRLSLTIGTKLLRTNFTRFASEPSARLAWTPSSRQTVWGAFTHAVRTPSDAEEAFYLTGYIRQTTDGTPLFARFNANPGFRPEQLNSTESGYRHLVGKNAYIGFTGFYNHYHNLFDQELTGPAFLETDPAPAHLLLPAKFGNGLLGTTKGFETNGELRPAPFWRLRGSYSYLMMNLKKAPESLDVGTAAGIVGSSPRYQVVVQSGFDFSKTLSLDLTYRYVSALVSLGVPSYVTADANLAWRLPSGFEFAIAGRNLFQHSHPEFPGDTSPLVGIQRSVWAKITWSR